MRTLDVSASNGPHRFALFDTAFGACAVAWNDVGLTAVRLPEADSALLRGRLRPRGTEAELDGAPAFVAAAVAAMQAHLAGRPQTLREVPLDWAGIGDFERKVYEASRAIEPGRTLSYGEMARAVGDPAAARAVGHALGANPWPLVVPCHRILAAGGRLGGFSAPGGTDTKRRLLALELAMCPSPDQLF